jgi:hypothetical protein
MPHADVQAVQDVVFSVATLLVQAVMLLHGMVRVTRDDVEGNSFANIWPLWAGTVPVMGWLVARRRQGVVRRLAMRMHAWTCAVSLVSLAWDAVLWASG